LNEYRTRIADLPAEDRPRERCEALGASGLSQRELLAILLRSGQKGRGVLALADALLAQFGDLAGIARADLSALQDVKGIGPIKAIELKAAFELGRRLALARPNDKVVIRSPHDAAQIMMLEFGMREQEEVFVLALDQKQQVLAMPVQVCKGGLNAASFTMRELFKPAIRLGARYVIVGHNHPSGDATPSQEDARATKRMIDAGDLLGIEVLDHLVIVQGSYASLKERGLAFT
jgi:DNA repair protein RadC